MTWGGTAHSSTSCQFIGAKCGRCPRCRGGCNGIDGHVECPTVGSQEQARQRPIGSVAISYAAVSRPVRSRTTRTRLQYSA